MHSLREFVELAFKEIGINIIWNGNGSKKVGINAETGKIFIVIDRYYYKPTEVEVLIGNFSKTRAKLGWQSKVVFEELVKMMAMENLTKLQSWQPCKRAAV